MNEKQMKFLVGLRPYVCDDVCLLLPQIIDNLAGHKGNFIQPLVAAINCKSLGLLWTFQKERDIPLAAAT